MADSACTFGPFVGTLEPGEPMSHCNMTVVPLEGNGSGAVDYVLGCDAMADGKLTVQELAQAAEVRQVQVRNLTGRRVLLVDGEELVGACQNRVLNTSVLLPLVTDGFRLPVSCVEQGRWRANSHSFAAGGCSPARLRATKSRRVSRSLRTTGAARSDQGEVWREVRELMAETRSSSSTRALSAAREQRRESLRGYCDALRVPDGARGVMFAIAGRFAALDVFDKAEALRGLWGRLVAGYALDAIRGAALEAPPRPFGRGDALAVLHRVAETPAQPCPSVGIGEDWRGESDAVLAQALVVCGVCVHLSAFPNDPTPGSRARRAAIQSPSTRGSRARTQKRPGKDGKGHSEQ